MHRTPSGRREDGSYGRVSGTAEDRATFDLITFSADDPEPVLRAGKWRVELGEPSWSALDRATVEALVGQEVD